MKKHVSKLLFVLATNIFLLNNIFAADQFTYWSESINGLVCAIHGPISKDDPIRLEKNISKGCKNINVSSAGGDVDAALTMGRAIRKAQMSIVIGDKGRCASACVFLYAGAVYRAPYAPIEIHRPYLGSSNASFEVTQSKYRELEKRIKTYLREMNVSEILFDLMMSIPPEKTKKLTIDEMEKMGMGHTDSTYAEYEENKQANRAGMTKQAWLERKSIAIKMCGKWGIENPETIESKRSCWRSVFPEAMNF